MLRAKIRTDEHGAKILAATAISAAAGDSVDEITPWITVEDRRIYVHKWNGVVVNILVISHVGEHGVWTVCDSVALDEYSPPWRRAVGGGVAELMDRALREMASRCVWFSDLRIRDI